MNPFLSKFLRGGVESIFIFNFMCMVVLPAHTSLHHVCAAATEARRGR